MRSALLFLAAFALAPVISLQARAQIQIGTLRGVVTDEVGAPVSGATVALENSLTGFHHSVTTDGGKARMTYLPDLGIRGNSHMIMQDRNNLRVADLILKWIDESVGGRKARSQGRPGKSIRR
jgi:hypothetical protein